jgi:hypothetical protein
MTALELIQAMLAARLAAAALIKADYNDFEIMRARVLATGRGATPNEIEINVLRLES